MWRARGRTHAGRGRAEGIVARAGPRPRCRPLTGRWRRRRSRTGGRGARRSRPARRRPGGRCRPGFGRRCLRAGTLIRRERHRYGRTRPRRCPWLRRSHCLDAGRAADLSRRCFPGGRRGRRCGLAVGSAPGGGRLCASAVAVRCLGRLACEFVLESADYRRLDCGGRRSNKFAHFLELGHNGLALDAELFREFVNPNLRHCAPSTRPGTTGPVSRPGQRVLRSASACAVHRRMLIGRSLQVSLLPSGASGCRHRHHARPAIPLLAG